jgi:putative heme-binding domain-containing protein
MELGIHLKGIVNCWGHAIDDFGQSFVTDGASSGANLQGGLFHVVPQAMYISYSGARRRLTSVSPGSYPKFASLEFIRSPHFPDDWQGNFVTCDFRAHRIVRFAIDEHQSSYVTREMPDLVRSTDVAFRPVDVKLGPDGALYIADWSNPIIQHGEVDFRDPRRDHVHGRIWRVTHKKRPVVPRENLEQSENLQLLDNLLHANLHTQQQSRRLLAEKGAAIVKDLRRWIKIQSSESALLQGLWMYQSVDRVETRLLKRLLNAKDGRIRAAAVRVLAGWIKRTPGGAVTSDIASSRGWSPAPLPLPRSEISTRQALQWLGSRIEDDHPQVRLETLRALARIPVARSAELALSALTQPMDPHLDYALWLTINDLADPWIDSLKNRSWKIQGHEDQLAFGLKSLPSARAAEVLSLLLPNPPIARDGSGPWIDLIAEAGTPLELQKLYDQTLDASLDYPTTARALAALDQAATTRNLKPPGDLAKVTALFDHPDSNVQVEAIRLAGQWQSPGNYLQQLGSFAGQESTPPQLRQASFATLRQLASAEAIATLSALAATGHPANIRREAVLALAAIDFTKAVPTAIELLNGFATEPEALAFWRSLLRFKGASKTIAQALPIAGIPTLTARTGLRAAREGGRTEPDLVLALTRGSGIEDGEVSLTPTELKQLASDVLRLGDPARGESVYRRNSLSCVACHAIGGAGGKVGPDLTSIGASAPVDYLIESVWFPHKKIKEGYHAVSVETDDGEEFSGVLLEENPTLLVLRDTTDRELSIAKNRITNRRMSTLSLMPAGLLDPVPAQDRIDLFRFLSELGKPGPFDGAKPGIARLWRLRRGTHNVEQFGVEKLVTSDLKNRAWIPLCSDVNGSLPAYRIRETVLPNNPKGLVGLFAATQLQLSKDSQITLGLQSEPNAIWINGKSHTPATALTLPLVAGTNTIVLRLDPQKLPPSLRLEASMGTFLTE